MNLKYSCKDSEKLFTEALIDSTVAQNWLINRLTGYANCKGQVWLEIGIDPWTKTDKPSFGWAIYEQPNEQSSDHISECKIKINGGLIYRGNDTYSSHT